MSIKKFYSTFCVAFLTAVGASATPLEVSAPISAIPPNIVTSSNKPMMMLTASKDHSLFGPVYNDFEDLDNDGVIDTTFKPTFKYYGYFDATKCYSYSNNMFVPSLVANTTGSGSSIKYSCPTGGKYWSGNFLNWVSMTRLDTVRKMLYGGFRSTDTNGSTVLMGSRLVWDAHSFVKYYNGADIRDYTPFTQADLIKTTGPNANRYAGLSICVTGTQEDPKTSQPILRLVKGNVRFWSTVEVALCRWRGGTERYNLGTFGPKLARFYADADKGNGGVAHEITIPEKDADGATYDNIGPDFNVQIKVCDPTNLGEERCQAFPPDSSTNFKPYGLLQEFGYPVEANSAARVEFGLITGSYDRKNTAGALRKNIRDMDDEINRATGVFCHSPSSGCAATLADGRSTGVGAIKSFDSIILFGRTNGSYGGGNVPSKSGETDLPAWGNPIGEMVVQALRYYAYDGTNSTPSSTNPGSSVNDKSAGLPVSTWLDPLLNTQARAKYGNGICRPLNILAFSSSGLSFDGQAGDSFNDLKLPNRARGELDSYVDAIGVAEGIHNTLRSVGSVAGKGLTSVDDRNSCAAKTVTSLSSVNGICPEAPAMGGTYQVAGAALYGNTSRIRTVNSPPSDLATIENALKVKTMAASLTGGSPRIDVEIPGSNPKKYVYITPESVQGGGNVSAPLTFASISSGPTYGAFIVTWNDILMGGDYDMDITGFLRYDLVRNSASPSGWDVRITTDIPNVCGGAAGTHGFSVIGVQRNGVSANGRYLTHQHGGNNNTYVNNLGGMPPASEYLCHPNNTAYLNTRLPNSTKIYRDTVCSVTGNGNTGDSNITNLPNYCSVKNEDYLVSQQFNMVGETDALIKDPLYYAAKYGAFRSSVRNSDGTYSTVTMPPDVASWDSERSDGTSGADGIPDGYFLARRPELLEAQLRRVLDAAAKDSNAAPAISSAQLVADTFKYVAKFDSTTVSGAIEAYKVNAQGDFATNMSWEAGALLKARVDQYGNGNRSIITNNGNASGVPFRWNDLPSVYQEQMTTASPNRLTAANAQIALNYIRGDQTGEGPNGLRPRGTTLLGPIVNGTPWLQTRPGAIVYGDSTYATFYTANKDRAKLLWVAANDGMLHAFNPDTGQEVMAYVPGALANRLAEIPLQRGTSARTKYNGANFVNSSSEPGNSAGGVVWPYVDGSPFSADVKVGSDSSAQWRTYLLGTLGRGGRGIFALDVTTVSNLTEARASSIFKWQFTSDDDADLGYITGDVGIHSATNQATPIVKMNDGKYAMIIGNGNKSKTGKAVLYILYMDGPERGSWSGRYRKLVVDAGTGNGLSTPRWEDLDGNGTADVAYAGDLKGNLWKFDLSSSDPARWDTAFRETTTGTPPRPLYRATRTVTENNVPVVKGLPITTAPQLLFMGKGGILVNFGTGNSFESSDFPSGVAQKIFGVWDRPGGVGVVGSIVQRVYSRDSATGLVTLSSGGVIDWSQNGGWYFDLPAVSEAVLSDPSLDAGVLSVVGVRPKLANSNQCSETPNATLYTIDPISGRAERTAQGSIMVNNAKVNVAGRDIGDQKVRVVNDRTTKPFANTCKAGEPGCTCTGSNCSKTPACGPGQGAKRVTGRNADAIMCYSTSPRLQWREVPGLRTNQ